MTVVVSSPASMNTFAAFTTTIRFGMSVTWSELVTTYAVSLVFVAVAPTPSDILSLRHYLQMQGVDASANPAEMVYL